MYKKSITLAIALLAISLPAFSEPVQTIADNTAESTPDNTKHNKIENQQSTAQNQGNDKADLQLSATLRRWSWKALIWILLLCVRQEPTLSTLNGLMATRPNDLRLRARRAVGNRSVSAAQSFPLSTTSRSSLNCASHKAYGEAIAS